MDGEGVVLCRWHLGNLPRMELGVDVESAPFLLSFFFLSACMKLMYSLVENNIKLQNSSIMYILWHIAECVKHEREEKFQQKFIPMTENMH
jgi:hypothetical protein